MADLYQAALAEIGDVFQRVDDANVEAAIAMIAEARRIAIHGVGREGLQMKGLAMRLFHLGLDVAVVGDMTTPYLGKGGLLIVSAGPGYFATIAGLMGVAREAGARVLLVTAQPKARCAEFADLVLHLPAQTMADDRSGRISVLPMGSLFEGAQYILFEAMILRLRDRLGVSPEKMRANHTNLE
ncbi:SIS domain-containing protein [Taklimakanibacter deserti]|uniref:SIS domain-containing protein n=1 Tax=Taklimakanibacter deserti TaxID=2267839 RepID=UPI000E655353